VSPALTPTSAPVYTEGTAGGTSVATPLIAGIQADAEQALGRPVGFADPAIYARYGTRAYHDVTDDPLGPGRDDRCGRGRRRRGRWGHDQLRRHLRP